MIKVENVETWGLEHAIRGMRNPMNSWNKSDSFYVEKPIYYQVGENDLDLMQRLYKAGHPHRKYLRQIMVSMDITAPLYWWKEFDTYKVGTTANSCSTMHKIHSKEFTLDDFSVEHLDDESLDIFADIISSLNNARDIYVNGAKTPYYTIQPNNKEYWWQMIQLLPSSYNQKRTVTFTYENVFNMLQYRQNHKLDEWNVFCEILKDLPYIKEIGGIE